MNPECCGKESKTSNRQSKASHPARKHACFCPPTMHDTKLDQLNKARVKGYQGRLHCRCAQSIRTNMSGCSHTWHQKQSDVHQMHSPADKDAASNACLAMCMRALLHVPYFGQGTTPLYCCVNANTRLQVCCSYCCAMTQQCTATSILAKSIAIALELWITGWQQNV